MDENAEKETLLSLGGNANKKKPPLEGNLVKQAQLKTQKNPLIQQFHF